MQYMLSLESSPTQAIRCLIILNGSYPSLERFINRFYHGFANLNGLKKSKLWLNPRHCLSAHEDGLLQSGQDNHQCPEPGWGHHQRGSEVSQPLRLNCHQLGIAIHLEILIIAMLFPWHQTETLYHLLSIDGRFDQKAE